MFAALLGYNPIKMLLGPALNQLPASSQAYLTGHGFFPSLISAPFEQGLQIAFDFSIACCLIAAVASLLRGKHYVHDMHAEVVGVADVVDAQLAPGVNGARADGKIVNGRSLADDVAAAAPMADAAAADVADADIGAARR
jgi:hypothetical protein